MHPVEAFLRSRVDLPKTEIDWLMSRMKVRVLNPGDAFCHVGQEDHEVGLLLSGLLRVYTVSVDGTEATLDFVFPVAPVAAIDAATSGGPSQVTIEAIETSSIAVWPFAIRDEAVARNPVWSELVRSELETLFRRKNRYARALQTKDAATRYQEWVAEHPQFLSRIPQYLLASYLGIAPQSLSCIRAQLAAKGGDESAVPGETTS